MKYETAIYFSCYSPNLKEFLEDNGFEVIKQFIHIRKGTTCWVFKRDDRMSIFLSQWSKNKQGMAV